MAVPFALRRRSRPDSAQPAPAGAATAPETGELGIALALADHRLVSRRLVGLRRLVALADARPALRQPVVSVLGASLRRKPASKGGRVHPAEASIRRAVLAALREHLADPDAPTTWCGLDVDLRDTVLVGDLSGIVVTGGAVRLDRAQVPAGGTLALRGARVRGGVLSMDRMAVAGRLDATDLRVSGGEASLDRLVVAGGSVVLDGARLSQGCLWLRDGAVTDGTLSLRGVRLTGGRMSLHDTHVTGGEIRLDDAHVDGGALHLSGATLDAGAVRLDDLRLEAGVLSLTLAAVHGGFLSLDGAQVGAAGDVRMHGLAVGDDATVCWGPFDPVEPQPGARPQDRPEVRRGDRPVLTSRTAPRRHDLPSPQERAAS